MVTVTATFEEWSARPWSKTWSFSGVAFLSAVEVTTNLKT